jgi:hypothetical protein
MLQIPIPGTPNVGVFCTGKIQVVQIMCSYFEMVLRNVKNSLYNGGEQSTQEVC